MAKAVGSDLMISISGVRGIVGRSLTPELVLRMGQAYGSYVHSGRVVVGSDGRGSGEMAHHALLAGLLSAGCTVLDLGVVATPTATLMVEKCQADGGVVISASHNPDEWNGLKFFRPDGLYLNADEGRDLLNLYYGGDFVKKAWNELRPTIPVAGAPAHHVERVLALLDTEAIRARKFRVAMDCVNGAGAEVCPALLEALGCHVGKIYCRPGQSFPHNPEPNTANFQELCRFTSDCRADVGFAVDPDGDRVALVTEAGVFLSEELGFALATQHALDRRKDTPGAVVINMSTSRVSEDVARAAGREVVRTAVGEINVAERMKDLGAVFGGEGNGGVIDPRLHYGRDAVVGIGLILEMLALRRQPLSALAAQLPRWHMVKSKVELPVAKSRSLVRRLKSLAEAARVNTDDGLRLDWEDRWVHLRASNTEPILRIIAEARTEAATRELIQDYTQLVSRLASE